MLQRSKRVLVTTVGSTPEQVGPGSYDLPKEKRLYETPWRLKGENRPPVKLTNRAKTHFRSPIRWIEPNREALQLLGVKNVEK